MFSTTAYEALYSYIGLHLHEASIKMLTSYQFFIAIMILIFGFSFFIFTWRYFNQYMPGVFKGGGSASLSRILKLILCLFLGMSLLRIGTTTGVRNHSGNSWHANQYIEQRRSHSHERYRVSFVFHILTRSAEEVSKFASQIVDGLFISANSQTQAPDYFYKAVMFAGNSTIDDPKLKEKIDFYTNECFDLLLPHISEDQNKSKLDRLFDNSSVAGILDQKTLKMIGGSPYTCLDLSDDVNQHLRSYAREKTDRVPTAHISYWGGVTDISSRSDDKYLNHFASSALTNHYLSKNETVFGIHKNSLPPGTTARVFQYLGKLFSWNTVLSVTGQSDKFGASQAASKAQEFSELLQRAPHIKGFAKMFLIAIFPWLVFFIIAGRWKILIFWTALYGSVLLWDPIWTLCYHIITNIAVSAEAIQSFDRLSSGVSLYSAQLINSRLYYAYSIYSWVQIFAGPLPTLILAANMRGMLSEAREEKAPTIVHQVKQYASPAVSAVSGNNQQQS